ncbi:hypothetical protein DID88_006684 [Monilinia fructigena]|uniref:Endonuclease/exonuclease/phosphatase domain-containing protein n=1 Tax=Monilinia fructigena TaxID=38457 RepID=A0A395ILH1_9HELO|nr:hypothetical protein DID88_006684 [Monilinia fructigena]
MAPQTPHRPTIANADTHTRERTAVSPTPFQSIGVPYGTAPVPPVTNPTGSPALETVLDRLERMEREAALRRLVFGNFAATIESFVRNSPEEHKVLAQEILNGSTRPPPENTPEIPRTPTTPAASPTVAKNAPAGPLKEKTDLRIYARAEPGSLLVRDQPFLIREAIVKAVPQIVAKDIPRLWATPTGWAVKPSTKAVYDLILKESNAIAICRATRCTTLERVEKWSTYRLAHVPNVLTGLLDNQLVTADIVSKEAEIQTGSKPSARLPSSDPRDIPDFPLRRRAWNSTIQGARNSATHFTAAHLPSAITAGWQRRNTRERKALLAQLRLDALDATAPFRQGTNTVRRPQRKVDGKFVRPTARQLGEIRRQQLATQKACELAAKRQQERTSKDGVQVVIPTPGARVANYEAANQQTRRHSDRIRGRNELYPRQQHGPRCNHFPYPIFMLENGAERCSEDCAIIRANGLKVAWANVGRSGPAHLALLQLAFEEQADVVCIQEPSAYPGTRTQNHPAYECYAPVDAWEQVQAAEREAERPRTMSYTRKAAGLTTQQRRNGTDRDIVWLERAADFIGDPGEPTHRAGHTIDLTFSNIPFAETKVRHDLDSGSDHFTLVTLIPGRGQQTNANTGYRVAEDSLERFAHIINSGVPLLPRPASAQGPGDLDDIARLLTILFQNAIKAVGKKAQNAARSAPWWTPACAELHASYAKARQRSEPDQERKRRTMLSTIRNAKRDYWRRIIDNAAEDADLYKVVGWHKLSPSLKAPPLVVDGISIESTREKAEALLEKVLHRYNDSDDLDYDPLEAEVRRPTLPWTTAISLEETEKNVIGVSSTSPGADRVTVRLLTACWQHIGEFIRDFFQRCLELTHFPSEWKLAEVVMLPKAGQGGDAGYTGRAGRVRCAATQKAFGTDAKAGLAYGAAPANQLVPSGSQGQGPAGGHGFKVSGKQRSHARARYTPDYEMGRYEQSGLCAGEAGNDTPLAETKRKLT